MVLRVADMTTVRRVSGSWKLEKLPKRTKITRSLAYIVTDAILLERGVGAPLQTIPHVDPQL